MRELHATLNVDSPMRVQWPGVKRDWQRGLGRASPSDTSAAGVEGAGGTGGHGRASRRGAWPRCRWAAAGPGRASRSITPSRRLACGDLAGGPPPTGTHSGRARQRPERQRRHKQHTQEGRRPRAHQAAQPTRQATRRPEHQRRHKQQHSTGARARRPAPLGATTQTRTLRSTCVRSRSARAARRSRRSSRSPHLRRRAGPRR